MGATIIDPHALNEELARRVEEARLAHKITKAELARRLGISPQAYNKVCKGKTDFTVHRLIEISYALRVPFTELLPEGID